MKLPPIFLQPKTWIIVAVVFVVLGIGGVVFFQYQKTTQELAKLKNSPGGPLTDDRQRELITEVSSKIMLPLDEKPTVAVVSDINRLKDQQFFSTGENGDVVLIYMNAKKAVLYRPAEKKIIEVAPVNLNNNQPASVAGTSVTDVGTEEKLVAQTSPQVTQPTPTPQAAKFALRNGTNVSGLAKTFETQLISKFPQGQVIERGNAKLRNYEKTVIVDVTGKRGAEAEQIATSLGITTGALPADEPIPSVDFLIIIGADKR